MLDIWKIFDSQSQSLLSDEIMEYEGPTCWYPSSYFDFRPIHYWVANSRKNKIPFPKLFIYSDWFGFQQKEGIDLLNRIKAQGEKEIYTSDFNLRVKFQQATLKNPIELTLKDDVLFPNLNLLIDKEPSFANNPFILFEGTFVERNELQVVEPTIHQFWLLYITAENTNLLYDVFLKDDISIDYLVHINDGGFSLGISRLKMDFIYNHINSLGVKEILVDWSLCEKYSHATKEWIKHEFFNPKVKRPSFFEVETELNLDEWNETFVRLPETQLYNSSLVQKLIEKPEFWPKNLTKDSPNKQYAYSRKVI